jgi:hypothetical protein
MIKQTLPEDEIVIHNMSWGERIIWFIGVSIFFSLAIYSSIERDEQKKMIYDQSWEIRDLKFDKIMLQNDVKFYKDMDSISKEFELNLLHKLNTLK